MCCLRMGVFIALVCAGFFVAGSPPAHAQVRRVAAELHGTLTDPTGAVITGASVVVRSEQTGHSWSATTTKDGDYVIDGLPAGNYEVHVQQNGFAESVKNVTLAAGGAVNLPITLSVAAIAQQVNVSSSPVNGGMDSQQIRESSARDLGEVLETIPGVEKVRKAGIANDIAVRGMFHENLATTIDGAHLYGACTGQMDPAAYHVDLSEVDHVDIVKGPFDVTTPGALGGFVKIVDKTPNVNGIKVTTNVSTGSYGYYNPSLVMQAGTRALHFLAGYSYRTSEMYRDASSQKVSALAAYRDGNENLQAFRTQSGWMKSAFQPSANQQFEIAYTRQQGGEVLYPYMMMDGIFDNADRFTARYDYFKPHPFLRSIHGLVYVNKVNHLMDNRLRSSAGTLPYSMSTHVVSFTTGGRVDADLTQDLTVGFESYRRYWNSNGMMIMNSMGMGGMGGNMITSTNTLPGVTEFVNGTYATLRKTLGGRFLFTSGARFDHSSTDASEANPALYQAYHGTAETRATDSGFSGNARLSWQASSWASVFAGVGSNIRFPDPEERFFRSDSSMSHGWVGNPLLRHPRDTEFDLGLTAKQRHYSLRPLIFFSKLDNYVALYSAGLQQAVTGVMSTTAQTYANVQAHQWGGELTGRVPLSSFLSLYGGLAYTRGTKVPQPANNIYSSNLFQVPPLRSELNLRYEQKRVYTEVSGIVTGRQDHVDTDEHEQVTAGYSVFNFRFGYRTARFHAEGGLNNVLNRGYTEFLSYARNPYNNGLRLPEPGRNFFVNLAWTLGRSSE